LQIPRLRQWRELRGLTQKELAAESGVSTRSIAGYEAGAAARPNTARKLAEALNIEVADFLAEYEAPIVSAPPSPEQQELFNGLEEDLRTWRWEAEDFIKDNKPLLDEESLTVVVSTKLAQRAAKRLTEVTEKFDEASQDENFPLTELNDLDNARQMLIEFTQEVIANHKRRYGEPERMNELQVVVDNTRRGVA
jgi:transcriptional regulator with XRE-family HTH domain